MSQSHSSSLPPATPPSPWCQSSRASSNASSATAGATGTRVPAGMDGACAPCGAVSRRERVAAPGSPLGTRGAASRPEDACEGGGGSARRPTPNVTRAAGAGAAATRASWASRPRPPAAPVPARMPQARSCGAELAGLPAWTAPVPANFCAMALALAAVVGSRAQQEHGKHALACCLHPVGPPSRDARLRVETLTNRPPGASRRHGAPCSLLRGRSWMKSTSARAPSSPA
jgi:hypothetical protein